MYMTSYRDENPIKRLLRVKRGVNWEEETTKHTQQTVLKR